MFSAADSTFFFLITRLDNTIKEISINTVIVILEFCGVFLFFRRESIKGVFLHILVSYFFSLNKIVLIAQLGLSSINQLFR